MKRMSILLLIFAFTRMSYIPIKIGDTNIENMDKVYYDSKSDQYVYRAYQRFAEIELKNNEVVRIDLMLYRKNFSHVRNNMIHYYSDKEILRNESTNCVIKIKDTSKYQIRLQIEQEGNDVRLIYQKFEK